MYQKLQAGQAINVIPSDDFNIPSLLLASGLATSTTSNKLVDSAGSFSNLAVPSVIHNTTDGTIAGVTAVDSATQLSLSADIMASGESYSIYAVRDNEPCVLYIGTGGSLRVKTAAGDIVTFTNIPDGMFFPVQVIQVFSTGTDASGIIALR